MIKIFHLFFLFFCLIFFYCWVFANQSIDIVSRAEWWANENYRYIDSLEWQKIIAEEKQILKNNWEYISDVEIIKNLRKPDYNENIESYLQIFFAQKRKIINTISSENSRELFWPISQSYKISWIIIHHTAWDYTDPYESIREIYKFHTLDRKWWDIWYNFLIAGDGTIFEWRAWWETAVWAHTKRNNIWNIWISLMWNYNHEQIPQKQLDALENLMKYLIEKYHIDINKKKYFHEDCIEIECEYWIESQLQLPIIAHRDSSTSSCPWEQWYLDFVQLRDKIIDSYKIKNLDYQKLYKIFDKYSAKNLKFLKHKLIVKKQAENNFKRKMIYDQIISILNNYLKEKY